MDQSLGLDEDNTKAAKCLLVTVSLLYICLDLEAYVYSLRQSGQSTSDDDKLTFFCNSMLYDISGFLTLYQNRLRVKWNLISGLELGMSI